MGVVKMSTRRSLGSVELGPCDTTADGRAQWAVSEGASIRSAHGFCLAMAGARPSIDASSEAKATASGHGFFFKPWVGGNQN